jgi:hypothetical protein
MGFLGFANIYAMRVNLSGNYFYVWYFTRLLIYCIGIHLVPVLSFSVPDPDWMLIQLGQRIRIQAGQNCPH